MAVEDRSLSEFPRALQVAEQALFMISNPDGLGGYDTNGAVLTEVGKALLNVQYTQQLGNVSVFDAIKNTRVLSGTTTPTANEGANGQLYVKYQTVSNVDTVVAMYFKKDGSWLEISLGGGGGASVTLGTTVPSDASGDNGDLYVQYDSSTYAVVEYFVKVNNSWRIAPYSRAVSLTQAQYDLITPDPTTLYIITDAQSGYLLKSGGDITGTLTYKTDIDPSTTPSATKSYRIVELDDDNDEQLFRLETYQDMVNTIRGQMVVSRKVGNNTILNYFNIGIRPDGTKDVGISDPALWQEAIGIKVLSATDNITVNAGTNRFSHTFTIPSGYTSISYSVSWGDTAIASTSYNFSSMMFGTSGVFVTITAPSAETGRQSTLTYKLICLKN